MPKLNSRVEFKGGESQRGQRSESKKMGKEPSFILANLNPNPNLLPYLLPKVTSTLTLR